MSTILIVDDEPSGSEVLTMLMNDAGYQAVCASSADEALALLRTQAFDLMLVDVMMPQINGLQLVRSIRDDPALARQKIVMWSAVADRKTMARCMELGALDYWIKGRVEWPEMRKRIEACLAGAKE